MKQKIFMLVVALLLSMQMGCQPNEPKTYTSYVPPETASPGEAIQLDPNSLITITGTRVEDTANGEKILLVTYDWTNLNAKRALIGESSYSLTARQDGVQLDGDLRLVSDKKKLVTELPAGQTLQGIEQGFKLLSGGDVTLILEGEVAYIFIDGVPAFNHPTEVPVPIAAS